MRALFDINEKSLAWRFGEKQAVSRWRQIANLQRLVFNGVKTVGDRNALQKQPWFHGDKSRADLLLSAKGKLGLPQELPKLQAEVAALPWRPVAPEIKDAIRSRQLPTLYRGTHNINPFWSTNSTPVTSPDGSVYHKTYVHGSALPHAAAVYGASFPIGGASVNLVSRHKPTGAERFTPDWGQEMNANNVGNTWREILQGMRGKLPHRLAPSPNSFSSAQPRPLRLPMLYNSSAREESRRPSFFSLPAYETKLRPDVNPHQGFSLINQTADSRSTGIADIPNTLKWQGILRSTLKDEPYNPMRDLMALREHSARQSRTGIDSVRDAVDSKYFVTPATRLLQQLLPPMNRQRIPIIDRLRERAAESLARRMKFSSARSFGEKLAP